MVCLWLHLSLGVGLFCGRKQEAFMEEHFYSKNGLLAMGKFAEVKGDLLGAFMNFSQKVFEPGALPEKTKEIIAIACAHITHCPYCIDGHVKQAKEAGATDEEIAEAIMVAVAMSAGASMAHGCIAMKALE
jgi:AhpD family alkylhydroperoxidase